MSFIPRRTVQETFGGNILSDLLELIGFNEPPDPSDLITPMGIFGGPVRRGFRVGGQRLRDLSERFEPLVKRGGDFFSQRFPQSVKVRVNLGDQVIEDEVKGLNSGHALARAISNWPTAKEIEVIDTGIPTELLDFISKELP